MKLSLTEKDLLILNFATIRCLIAKEVLTKEDLLADLGRQGIDADTAFRLKAALDEVPKK